MAGSHSDVSSRPSNSSALLEGSLERLVVVLVLVVLSPHPEGCLLLGRHRPDLVHDGLDPERERARKVHVGRLLESTLAIVSVETVLGTSDPSNVVSVVVGFAQFWRWRVETGELGKSGG